MLALKGADEPAVERVDLHLGRRVRLQYVEADFRGVADPVSVGADERLHREVGDQLISPRDAGQIHGRGGAAHRIDRLPHL